MEAPKGSLVQVAVEGEVYRGGVGLPRRYQGTRVGCISTRRKPPEEGRDEGWGESSAGDEGEEGGPGRQLCNFLCFSFLRTRGQAVISFVQPTFPFVWRLVGGRR